MTASEKIMEIAESIHLLLKQKEERANDR